MLDKPGAIQILKKNIQIELGKAITTRRHCEELEHEVHRKTGVKLSYNTIRRFFNLAGKLSQSEPSVSTLDILANYAGFRDFHSLKIGMTKSESLEQRTSGQIAVLSGVFLLSSRQKVNFLENHISDNSWPLLVSLIAERAAAEEDRDFFALFFDSGIIFQNSNYLNQRLYFGMQYLGVIIRNLSFRNELQRSLACHEFGRKFYYELFVDMDSLVLGFYKGVQVYFNSSIQEQDKLFASALLHFRAWMAGNKVSRSKWFNEIRRVSLNPDEIHPIPMARSLNAHMFEDFYEKGMVSPATNKFIKSVTSAILKSYLRTGQADMFFFWLLQGAVITQNWKIAELCILQIEKVRPKKLAYYDEGSYELFKALKGITLLRKGNLSEAEKCLAEIEVSKYYSFSLQFDTIFVKALNYLISPNILLKKEGRFFSQSMGYGKLWEYLIVQNSSK
jgi:hypothetical protein